MCQSFAILTCFRVHKNHYLRKNYFHLRELTKVKAVLHWDTDHSMAFEAIKNALDHNLVLHFFNPKLQTVLVTDATIIWLGFLLYQDAVHKGAPRYCLIQCGSRSMGGLSPNMSFAN